jgi:hypothetical protein
MSLPRIDLPHPDWGPVTPFEQELAFPSGILQNRKPLVVPRLDDPL